MSDYFPTDVTVDILKRLPVKSLIRFTAVCKSWRSLITAPSFISAHLSIASTRPTRLLRRYHRVNGTEHYSLLESTEHGILASTQIDFPFKSDIGYFQIVGSCNGLLCLSDSFAVPQRIILWNPTVRKSVTLPRPGINPRDPYSSVLGFGAAGDAIKVVRLVYSSRKPDANGLEAEVYSLKKRCWRRLDRVTVNLQILELIWPQALLNEVVHWFVYEFIEPNRTIRSSVLAFDFATEDFRTFSLPAEVSTRNVGKLTVFLDDGLLGLVAYRKESAMLLEVWIMKEYGVYESWMKLYKISSRCTGIEKVVALCSKTEALVALSDNELGCFDSESNEVKKLGISGSTSPFYVDDFVESLALVGGSIVVEEDVCNRF